MIGIESANITHLLVSSVLGSSYSGIIFHAERLWLILAQSAGAVEYTDCFSVEG